jgi:hypothetical protein
VQEVIIDLTPDETMALTAMAGAGLMSIEGSFSSMSLEQKRRFIAATAKMDNHCNKIGMPPTADEATAKRRLAALVSAFEKLSEDFVDKAHASNMGLR